MTGAAITGTGAEIRIGLIGCGVMGADHADILHRGVAGGRLVAAHDTDAARAAALAERLGLRVAASARDLIDDPAIDAVLIAAPDETHAELTLACIEARKPVLVEKPLAATAAEGWAIVAAEAAAGRRLVQVGFMRRCDPGYRAMRAAARDEAMGAPLFLHCVHRNKVAPDYITSDRVIANSVLHEIDIARFLLDEEFAAVTVTAARASRHAPGRHPLLVLLETTGGTLVSVEMSPDARYGYDVRAELVCEEGTVSLAPAPPVATRRAGWDGHAVPADWRPRFAEAYRVQLHEWIAALRGGDHRGASAWDGYVATATAEAALRALGSGQRALVRLDQPPAGPGP